MEENLSSSVSIKGIKKRKLFFAIKRLGDFVCSLIGIVVLIPVMLIIAILIRIEDNGPAIFIQTRTGKDGKPFSIYKFRSMKVKQDKNIKERVYTWENGVPDNFMFKQTNEINPNITKVGAFIRKTSLDEIPQLFNVLIGNMSLIGPRPEIPEITKHYNENQRMRLKAKPGITGWAQVNGRSDITMGEKINLDNYYIKNQNSIFDLIILCKTILVIFTTRGAV